MPTPSTEILATGLTIATEVVPGAGSVGIAWILPGGVARDPAHRIGLSALHAEMLLRGDHRLDSRAQADAFDALGASRSASVGTFGASIGATCLGARLGDVLPLVMDMGLRPRMSADDLAPVRDLCLQAIDSLADDPQDRVSINLRAAHAPDPINRSTLGTREGIEAVTAEELAPEWAKRAVPTGSILAIAGAVDHAKVVDQVKRLTETWKGAALPIGTGAPGPRGYHHEEDDTDQIHIAVAYDAPAETSPDAWLERMATAVLSGGMAGRLFSEIREKRSLCYSVHAGYGGDTTFGRTVAYAGTTPERAQETLDLLLAELRRIRTPAGAVTEAELDRARVGMVSRLVFAGESTGARASAIAGDIRKIGRARSMDDMLRKIEGVTLEVLNAYLARTTDLGKISVATIGPAALKVG